MVPPKRSEGRDGAVERRPPRLAWVALRWIWCPLLWGMVAAEFGIPSPAAAWLPYGVGRWQGKATFYLDYENQDDKRSNSRYETILFQERIGLRNVGAYILDPRFLTLNLGSSFGLSQEDGLSLNNTPLRVGNGTLYDYNFEGLFLSDQPYPVTLFANRDQNQLTQGFGGQSDVTFEEEGGVFELREDSFLKEKYDVLNFSSLLDVRRERLKENSSVFGTPFNRDERRNIVRYRAHKGGETSDFDLRYELNDVSDPLNPTNVFDSHTVRAMHSIDFGPTLNRRLDSGAYYFDRTGSSPGSYLSLDEGLHLDHYDNLATDYRYNFSQSDSTAGVVTTNGGNASLIHTLYHSLTSTLLMRGMSQSFPTGDKTIFAGQGGFGYRRPIAWQGNLFVDTLGGYEVDKNNFTSSEIQVVDEPHTAPPVLGVGAGFTLNNPNVITGTIVMVDVRGGSRLPTTLNVDYVLSPDGNLTKIIPLPTSAVIQPNDPLEVSYSFGVDPNLKYSTTTMTARVGVDFPFAVASYEHVLSDQSRLSGTPSPNFLINQNLDRFKLEGRGQWNDLQYQLTTAYEILRSTIVDSNGLRFAELLLYRPSSFAVAQLSGDQYFVDYPGQNRHSQSFLVRGSIDWFLPMGLTASTFSGYRSYYDTAVPTDEIIDCGVRARWLYHDLEIAPAVIWTDYLTRLSDLRAELRVTRHFF